ncbi:bifunctional endo-1,4-beta-xylanase XylA-like [Malaya genurostris]|uniref:bifunctional endo-1,4-beta-xylanase XylA-like n=1 Tax=Malaya genurostris TaxID=325434 RepID=UPI0026F40655|nr:bifunctional endo-1,4-beta-xylanase XylA-like [Malaya genurostris]
MFKLILISALIAAVYCAPADKAGQDRMDISETSWNPAWSNHANPNAAWQNPNAWGANSWNRWNNPSEQRWNRWGANADPWNRWGGANAGWNQWNRAGTWPAGGAAANRAWNPW